MHEVSIGQSIIDSVIRELNRRGLKGGRLLKVRVVVGQLHQVAPDSLNLAYEVLGKGTRIEGSELDIRVVPISARCRQCGWNGAIQQAMFVCGSCGGVDIELTSGKELYLESLEVEQDDGIEH